MGKVIAEMNFNYFQNENSNLAQTLLEIYKVSLNNGTYVRMSALFDREIPSSRCFDDSKHKDLDNMLTFNKNIKQAINEMTLDEPIIEDTRGKTM